MTDDPNKETIYILTDRVIQAGSLFLNEEITEEQFTRIIKEEVKHCGAIKDIKE